MKQITVAGGSLFDIAARYLGDATQANRIATLNNLTDPYLSGVVTLKLPARDLSQSGGLPFGPVTIPAH